MPDFIGVDEIQKFTNGTVGTDAFFTMDAAIIQSQNFTFSKKVLYESISKSGILTDYVLKYPKLLDYYIEKKYHIGKLFKGILRTSDAKFDNVSTIDDLVLNEACLTEVLTNKTAAVFSLFKSDIMISKFYESEKIIKYPLLFLAIAQRFESREIVLSKPYNTLFNNNKEEVLKMIEDNPDVIESKGFSFGKWYSSGSRSYYAYGIFTKIGLSNGDVYNNVSASVDDISLSRPAVLNPFVMAGKVNFGGSSGSPYNNGGDLTIYRVCPSPEILDLLSYQMSPDEYAVTPSAKTKYFTPFASQSFSYRCANRGTIRLTANIRVSSNGFPGKINFYKNGVSFSASSVTASGGVDVSVDVAVDVGDVIDISGGMENSNSHPAVYSQCDLRVSFDFVKLTNYIL